MEKNKYYIIRDVEDLELGFKLFNFEKKKKEYNQYHTLEKLEDIINSFLFNKLLDSVKDKPIVIYSNDEMEYLGWDYFDYISYKNYQVIEFKVYLRKKKLEMLNNYGKE